MFLRGGEGVGLGNFQVNKHPTGIKLLKNKGREPRGKD